MAGVKKALAIYTVFLVFSANPTCSTPSSELLSKTYAQIAQHFGFSSPKLPNITFSGVDRQCIDTLEKLNISEIVQCEYFLVIICTYIKIGIFSTCPPAGIHIFKKFLKNFISTNKFFFANFTSIFIYNFNKFNCIYIH